VRQSPWDTGFFRFVGWRMEFPELFRFDTETVEEDPNSLGLQFDTQGDREQFEAWFYAEGWKRFNQWFASNDPMKTM
jgi:hypothetical protein